ncbi:MAG TPA: AsmA-like C-terminal domain-containing protein [Rhizomicrobium sp.]|jgi:hypothetical protein
MVRRAIWLAAAVGAAIVFFAIGLIVRVLMGPVSLGPLSGELRSALREVLPGLDVRFDDAALEWSREEGRIDLVVLGTRIFDHSARIIAQAPKAEIGLAVVPFLRGQMVVKRITLVGVQLTLVHTRDGALRLGVEKASGESDVLQRLRDAITHGNGHGSLQSFAVHHARLAFYDEETGAFVVAPAAELQVTTPEDAHASSGKLLTASLSAEVEISGKPARVLATVNLPQGPGLVTGDVSITGLNLPAVARNAARFGFLAPLALTADVTASWSLAGGTQLHFVDFGVAASGIVNGLGQPLRVKSLKLLGRYDGPTNRLLIDDGDLEAIQARAHFAGSAALRFGAAGSLESSAFRIGVDRLAIDMPDAMAGVVPQTRVDLQGTYAPSAETLVLDHAFVSGGPLSAAFAGKLIFAPGQSPEIDADGKINALSVRDLLRFWPLHIVPGARAWIDTNVLSGRIGPVAVHTQIPPGGLDRSSLADKDISASFPLTNATFVYVRGLTPVTKATGTALLSGDTFRADFPSAVDGPLLVTAGQVMIPNLHIHGTPATISSHVEGELPDVLSLLDKKPLQYPSRFHINTASTRGSTKVDLSVRVPTIRGVGIDQIAISAKGSIGGFAVTLGPHTRITSGTVGFDINNDRLRATGDVGIGDATLALDWLESFKARSNTTQLTLHGRFDDAARDALALPGHGIVSGPVTMSASLQGYRGTIQRALIDLDLTSSTFGLEEIGWSKAAGIAADAHIAARMDESGDMRAADLSLNGSGISAKGTVSFGAGGTLQSLELPNVRLGTDNDFAVTLSQKASTGLDVAVSGHSVDASKLGRPGAKAAPGQKVAESIQPFHLAMKLDRLALRSGVWLAPFNLDATGVGRKLRTLTASGAVEKAAPFAASIVPIDNQRRITLTAGDAGLFVKGLLGFSSVKGGQLSLHAVMPALAARPDQTVPDYTGELIIHDCTILNQPFLARLFSSGSFGGILDLMRGQGISMDTVDVPFRINGDIVTIHDARASGPSIGVTADGYVDRRANHIALQGAMAPLYGLNSILGAIPLVGNVFVSKKGEGLFGVTYGLGGDLDEPKVTMNPLSVLAPGILRRLFEGSAPTAPPPVPNP